ncbi:MAG: peptidase dimerization domain-containing protein [Acidobacteria bacterium]|nr:peptidase dimerization domain-containing protein [Acidobacteriota bacterium]
MRKQWMLALGLSVTFAAAPGAQRGAAPAAQLTSTPTPPGTPAVEQMKKEAGAEVEELKQLSQQMVDEVFSFAEPGFQEFETARYLTGILEQNGFTIERGYAGIPTAWVATWGSGKPVIAIGSDVDDIPQASQKPGVAYRDPLVAGAPGHGEGHNSGVPMNIAAALAAKKIMERGHLSGTLKLWPGVAEELLGTKAYYVRAGLFKDVDICLFAHVGTDLSVHWGGGVGSGLVSVQYTFTGESAHAAGAPWRGRSALDAAELMDMGWNARREHLRLQQRSHDVIINGGDQPNVVPPVATSWYYFREIDYPHIKELWDIGNTMAKAAAMMTGTEVTWKLVGSAWPQHQNKTIAETMYSNIRKVGLPAWDEKDLALAKAVQRELKQPEQGLATEIGPLTGGLDESQNMGGFSDDIGDVSWNVPTATLMYPSNIPGLPGHNWVNAIAMATPLAHKGVVAGAKVQAMTIIDFVTRPELVKAAWDYFNNVQTKNQKYVPFIGPDDKPAIDMNKEMMDRFRPEMKKYYYDPAKFPTYLDQLGITYPTLRTPAAPAPQP